jgi:YfiH family protein
MIRPEGFEGAAFGTLAEGDLRFDDVARRRVADHLGLSHEWAYVTQVHGATVKRVTAAGFQGEADGMFTSVPGLPLVVATADCVPIILEGPGVAAVVHAGWRGAAAGVVREALRVIAAAGFTVERAAVGPAIGPACYEVGEEVATRFPGHVTQTSWGTQSIDLPSIVMAQVEHLHVWDAGVCTFTDSGFASYRRDHTDERQVAVAWLPND